MPDGSAYVVHAGVCARRAVSSGGGPAALRRVGRLVPPAARRPPLLPTSAPGTRARATGAGVRRVAASTPRTHGAEQDGGVSYRVTLGAGHTGLREEGRPVPRPRAAGARGRREDAARLKWRAAADAAAAAWYAASRYMHAAARAAGCGCGSHPLLERDPSRPQQRVVLPLLLPSHLLPHRRHRRRRRRVPAAAALQPRRRAARPRRACRTRRIAAALLQAATGLQRVGPRLLRRPLGRLWPERGASLALEACRGPRLLRAARRRLQLLRLTLLPRRRRRRSPGGGLPLLCRRRVDGLAGARDRLGVITR